MIMERWEMKICKAGRLGPGGFPDDCHTDNGPYGLPNTAIEK